MQKPKEKGRSEPSVIKHPHQIENKVSLPNSIISDISEIDKRKPTRKFKTIVIDPPWQIYQNGKYGASQHYDLMTIEQIKGLPIPDLLEENAHVWLWSTNAALPYAFDILKHWGLTYRSPFYYCKTKMGLGTYLRNASEPLLLATRGKAPVGNHSQINWSIYPVLEHSHKPEEIMTMIRRLSLPSRLEMFARRPEYGFDAWGAEIPSDIIIPGYPVPEYTEKAGTPLPEDIAPPGMFKSSKPKRRKND